MKIWRKWYKLRRFGPQKIIDGFPVRTHSEKSILIDIQPDVNSTSIDTDGKRRITRITSYGNDEVWTDSVESGIKADWIFFNGSWYECETSMYYEHTPLAHYTATWIRVPEGADKK